MRQTAARRGHGEVDLAGVGSGKTEGHYVIEPLAVRRRREVPGGVQEILG